ncbi:mannosyltransferase family protein [Baekduia soli]|uniref:mannosyltransferase family protein n=1 Tax=Baekduia soli TaxID=496014 RepID=UPI001652475A|nr:mannosyltransferase family protein [Baekduia soli]
MALTVQEQGAATRARHRAPLADRADLAAAWRAFWISRVVVWAAGLAAIGVWGQQAAHRVAFDPAGLTRPYGPLADLLVGPAARWDSVWFLAIAGSGYDGGDRTAFFPLYPLLVRVGGILCGSPLLAAIAISCAAFLAALAVLHRLAVLEVGDEAARWAVLALALFPGALWFSAAYSESLFLLVSVGAVLCARTGRWAAAGVLGALAAATRSAGLLLLVPLALLWLDGWRARGPGRARVADLAWLGVVPLGLLAYCGFLALGGHGFTAPFSAQDTWHRSLAGPWAGVRDGAVAAWDGARQVVHGAAPPVYFRPAGGDPVEVGRHNLMLFGFLVAAVPALAGALRRLPLAHGAYAATALLLPLSYPVGPQPLMSLPRFEAVLYPLFLWIGLWLARGSAARRAVVLGLFAAGLAAFSALFSTWHWVA